MTEVVGKKSAVSTDKQRRETEPQVVFHVTGFGRFAGISDNPTKHLIENLPAALSARGIRCVGGTGVEGGEHATGTSQMSGVAAFQVQTVTVLHVSAKEGGRQVREIHRAIDEEVARDSASGTRLSENPSVGSGQEAMAEGGREAGAGAGEPREPDHRTHVLIHCGVNDHSTAFALETLAYNEATFRVPDEAGYRPTGHPVDETDPDVSRVLSTTLPVGQIRERLGTKGWGGEHVLESTSAGRFVCNFVFYTSLNLCEAASRTPPRKETGRGDEASPSVKPTAPRHCLFLHVPKFRFISQERQMDFLVDCLTAIAEELRPETLVTSGPRVSSGPRRAEPLLRSPSLSPSPAPSDASPPGSPRKESLTSQPLHIKGRSSDGADSSVWRTLASEQDLPPYQSNGKDQEALPSEYGGRRLETMAEATRRALIEAGFEEPDVDAAMATTGSDDVEVNMQCLIDVMPLLPQGSPASGDPNELRRFLNSVVQRKYIDSMSPGPGHTRAGGYERGPSSSRGIRTPRRTLGGVSPSWARRGTSPTGQPTSDHPSPASKSSTETPSPSTHGLLNRLRRNKKRTDSGEIPPTAWGTVPRHTRELSKSSVVSSRRSSRSITKESPSPQYSRRTTGNSNLQSPSRPLVRSGSLKRTVEVAAGWESVPGGSNLGLVMMVRLDLKMAQGVIAVQCTRAALAATRKAESSGSLDNLAVWRDAGEPMVVLGARNAQELGSALEVAATTGLPVTMVREKGAGWSSDVISVAKCTVAAIGPASISEIFAVVGLLPVL